MCGVIHVAYCTWLLPVDSVVGRSMSSSSFVQNVYIFHSLIALIDGFSFRLLLVCQPNPRQKSTWKRDMYVQIFKWYYFPWQLRIVTSQRNRHGAVPTQNDRWHRHAAQKLQDSSRNMFQSSKLSLLHSLCCSVCYSRCCFFFAEMFISIQMSEFYLWNRQLIVGAP